MITAYEKMFNTQSKKCKFKQKTLQPNSQRLFLMRALSVGRGSMKRALMNCLKEYKLLQNFEKQIGSLLLRNFKIQPLKPN